MNAYIQPLDDCSYYPSWKKMAIRYLDVYWWFQFRAGIQMFPPWLFI